MNKRSIFRAFLVMLWSILFYYGAFNIASYFYSSRGGGKTRVFEILVFEEVKYRLFCDCSTFAGLVSVSSRDFHFVYAEKKLSPFFHHFFPNTLNIVYSFFFFFFFFSNFLKIVDDIFCSYS